MFEIIWRQLFYLRDLCHPVVTCPAVSSLPPFPFSKENTKPVSFPFPVERREGNGQDRRGLRVGGHEI